MSKATTTPELTLSRTFDAPRSLVFEAFAKEEHLVQWFGPRSFPVTSWSHDFRPGGTFQYVMQGSGGIQAPGRGFSGAEHPRPTGVRDSRTNDGDWYGGGCSWHALTSRSFRRARCVFRHSPFESIQP